jgi:hypothetical protein
MTHVLVLGTSAICQGRLVDAMIHSKKVQEFRVGYRQIDTRWALYIMYEDVDVDAGETPDLNRVVSQLADAATVLVSVGNVSRAGIWVKARVRSARVLHSDVGLTVMGDLHVWRYLCRTGWLRPAEISQCGTAGIQSGEDVRSNRGLGRDGM